MDAEEVVKKAIVRVFGEKAKIGRKNGMRCIFYLDFQFFISDKTYSALIEYARSLE